MTKSQNMIIGHMHKPYRESLDFFDPGLEASRRKRIRSSARGHHILCVSARLLHGGLLSITMLAGSSRRLRQPRVTHPCGARDPANPRSSQRREQECPRRMLAAPAQILSWPVCHKCGVPDARVSSQGQGKGGR